MIDRTTLTPQFFVGREILDPTPYEHKRPPEDLGICPICGAPIGPKDRVCVIDIMAGRVIHEDCADHKLSLNQFFARLDLEDLMYTGNAGKMWEEGEISV